MELKNPHLHSAQFPYSVKFSKLSQQKRHIFALLSLHTHDVRLLGARCIFDNALPFISALVHFFTHVHARDHVYSAVLLARCFTLFASLTRCTAATCSSCTLELCSCFSYGFFKR